MSLSICVWWNIRLGEFHVYQCDLEALVDLFKEHVMSLMLCQYIYMHTNTAVVLQTALPSLRRRNCFIPGLLDTTHCIQPQTPDTKNGNNAK